MGLQFRAVKEQDFEKIIEISESYFNKLDSNGFLVKLSTREELKEYIKKDLYYMYVAQDDSGNVVGYVSIKPLLENKSENKFKYRFLKEETSEILEDPDMFYINQLAVDNKHKRKGIASFLYQNLFDIHRDTDFTVAIVTGPIENSASIYFHQKHGFSVIAKFEAENYRGLENYRSVYMGRIKG